MNAGIAIAALVALLGLGAVWFLVPFALRKYAEIQLAALCRSRRAIVLTFDDGPGQQVTPRLLDTLRRAGVKASFYVLGRNAKRSPEILRRVIADGHDIGSHTFNHSNAWKTLPWQAARDLEAGINVVREMGGNAQNFRPPFGKLTAAGLIHGALRGLRYGWWTIDTRDSWARRPIGDVVAEIEANGGGVILMHDFDTYEKAPADPPHIEHVLALTNRLLDLAHDKGYRVVPLSALAGLPPADRPRAAS